MLQPQHITEFFINNFVSKGDVCIDATAGNGNDTLKLAKSVGNDGKVYAFDIQQMAIENTKKLLEENEIKNVQLILDSHVKMDEYVKEEVKCVLFNLGYLPGGDHSLQTKAETTKVAIEKSLELICDDGFVAIMIYYGKNSGTAEKEAVMEFLKIINHKKYTVTIHDFYNRPNNPPITAVITKN